MISFSRLVLGRGTGTCCFACGAQAGRFSARGFVKRFRLTTARRLVLSSIPCSDVLVGPTYLIRRKTPSKTSMKRCGTGGLDPAHK